MSDPAARTASGVSPTVAGSAGSVVVDGQNCETLPVQLVQSPV